MADVYWLVPVNINKYLIVGPAWVGDMVMAQSLFIDIKQRQPDSIIDVLAPAWTAALTDRMPEVSQLINCSFEHGKLGLAQRYKLGKSLRSQNYTHSIVLPNSLKSALVPWIAKITHRSGFLGDQRRGLLNHIHKLDKQTLPMTVQRFIALGRADATESILVDSIPKPYLTVNNKSAQLALKKYKLSDSSKTLVLCPGAEFGASKQWPAEHYAQVANTFLDRGWQVWLFGSDNDLDAANKINALAQTRCQIVAGQTSLPEAIDLMSFADLVISNDSGLMHIAAALQKPLVAVYGSTDPAHTPPLSDNSQITRLDLDCSPCFKRQCPLQHLNCLQQLSPQSVIDCANELLYESST